MAAGDGNRRRMALWPALVAGVTLCVATTAGQAGEVADRAAKAEALLRSGTPAEAFETLAAAVDAFWTAAPLTIRKAYFVDDEGDEFSPRADGPFRAGERVRIHVEPLGYGFSEDSGLFRIALTTGIEIRTPGGLILAKSEDFGRLEWTDQDKSRTFNGRVGIELPDLKPGDYEILLTLDDEASQKTASVTLPFSVAAN